MSLTDAIGSIVIGSQIFDAQQLLNALQAVGLSIQQTDEGILINGVLLKPDAVLDKNVCPLSPICQQRAHFLSVLRGKIRSNVQQTNHPQQNENLQASRTTTQGFVGNFARGSIASSPPALQTPNNGNGQQNLFSSPDTKSSGTREDDVEKFLERILRPKSRNRSDSMRQEEMWKRDNSYLCNFCFTPRIGQEKYCRTCGEEFY